MQSLQARQTMRAIMKVEKITREAMMRAACWEMVGEAPRRQTVRSRLGAVEAMTLILVRWL